MTEIEELLAKLKELDPETEWCRAETPAEALLQAYIAALEAEHGRR